ncbi:hypothetical protein [Flavobacterium sp.]|uniref:hypothetical protein n=1 Tax=Flavobacterium sp. TaxID=239 RepID=UPI00404751C2
MKKRIDKALLIVKNNKKNTLLLFQIAFKESKIALGFNSKEELLKKKKSKIYLFEVQFLSVMNY